MSEISDELRRLNNSDIVCGHTWVALQEIADRIDREMVELPKDADGEPIHVRDTVFVKSGNGEEEAVSSITLAGGTAAVTTVCRGIKAGFRPEELTHERPDSLKRIADELEGLSVDSMVSDTNLLSSCALDLAKRIRRLAEREG